MHYDYSGTFSFFELQIWAQRIRRTKKSIPVGSLINNKVLEEPKLHPKTVSICLYPRTATGNYAYDDRVPTKSVSHGILVKESSSISLLSNSGRWVILRIPESQQDILSRHRGSRRRHHPPAQIKSELRYGASIRILRHQNERFSADFSTGRSRRFEKTAILGF